MLRSGLFSAPLFFFFAFAFVSDHKLGWIFPGAGTSLTLVWVSFSRAVLAGGLIFSRLLKSFM